MAMIGVASCWFNTLAGAGTGTSRYTVSSQRLFSSSSAATRLVIPKAAAANSQSQNQHPKKKKSVPKKSSPEKEANIQKLSRRSRDENQYSNADDQNGIKNAEQPQSTAFKSFGTQRKNAKGFMGTLKDQQAETTQIQDASFLNAVVKVYCTHTAPDYSLPWQKQRQYTSTGSAFMIGDGKLLTNAHCVEHNTQVKVKKRGDDTKYVAKVLAKGMECDIALLSVENEKFWKGAEPLQFGHLPRLQDPVTVVGYPLGGDTISVTKGVVSRIEVTSYAHGSAELLGIQIDAAINPGNSGGPAFNDQGECIGVAFQVYRSDDTENIGYVIPTTVVSHFLDDYERNGKYTGFPSLGILLQKLENPALRACLKVPSNEGVLVRRVEPTSGASNVLKEGDVIVSFDGVDVGSEGTVPFRSTERIAFRYLISQKFTGDIAELGIIRAGASMKVQTAMNPRVHLVPYHIEGGQPSYLIVAGLVFTPLSEPLIDEECEDSIGLKLLTKARYSMARFKGEQIVILSQFFTVISRVATILKTRYTSPGFWSAGLGLFLEAEQLVSESSEKQHLHTCIARAREQLSEIENQPEESAQNRRNQGYLFEGHLTVDQEPPRPQWLVQSNLMTALAASMSQAQTSTDGATDGFNSLPQELMDRIHELVPNISDESNNLPQEMIDRLVAMFPEGDSVAKAPPASKEVVAKLPVITITDEILAKLGPDAECAICKENLLVNDKMQEMPCKHTFHPPCLKPWLDEHNSCLICRHELRTNDHEYESRKEREKEAEEERKGAANSVREGEYMYV